MICINRKEIRRPTKPTKPEKPKRPLDPNEDPEVNQVMDGLGRVVKKKDQAKGRPRDSELNGEVRAKNTGTTMRVEEREDKEGKNKRMNANALAYDHDLEMDPDVDGEMAL